MDLRIYRSNQVNLRSLGSSLINISRVLMIGGHLVPETDMHKGGRPCAGEGRCLGEGLEHTFPQHPPKEPALLTP